MLLRVHVTSVLFLVLAGNSALTTGFYWSYTHSYSSRLFLCALEVPTRIIYMYIRTK